MQAHNKYYIQTQQYVDEQVGGVRREVEGLRTELGDLRNYIGGRFDNFAMHFKEEQRSQETKRKRREGENVYMETYQKMMQDMHRFYPYFPEDYQRYDPNNSNKPPPPVPSSMLLN